MEVMIVPSLQHLPRNVSIAVGALDPELLLVVLLTVRHSVLAHVLAVQHGVTGLALEAPDVPLAVQRDQRLALLELLVAAGALVAAHAEGHAEGGAGAGGAQARGAEAARAADAADAHAGPAGGGRADRDLHAPRTQHLLARVRHPLAGREGLPAAAAREALLVVRVAERRHHLALHVLVADGAFGAELALVVGRAVVGAVLAEEPALRQRVAAHFALEAGDVEVLVLHAQHLPGAFLLAALAVRLPHCNWCLLREIQHLQQKIQCRRCHFVLIVTSQPVRNA